MSDLISRQDAREAIEKLMEIHFDRQVVLAKARDAIVSLPSAEPKTGEWIAKSERYRWMRKCSVCGWMQEVDTPKMQGWIYRYCPNCGARMKGADDED